MIDLVFLEPWWRFGAALLLGAIIGLEREFIQQREQDDSFAGLRTFSFISLLGAVAAFASNDHGATVFFASYAGLILLVVVGYIGEFYYERNTGATTEVAALVTFLLGALIIWDYATLAISLGIIVAILLSLKPRLHSVVRSMSVDDLKTTLQFALIAGVILPLLPNENFGPFNVINLSNIWLLVVMVSGIGFSGYVLMKVFGTEKGIGLTGLLGGLTSSTATTLSFASRSKEIPALSGAFARAIILASGVMLPRIFVLVLVAHAPLLGDIILPLGAMVVTSIAVVLYMYLRQHRQTVEQQETVEIANPLKLSTAITFGLLFAVITIAIKLMDAVFGATGIYVTALITGLIDVNAITLSAANLAGLGELEPQVAAAAIIIAAIVNTISKLSIAFALGAPALRRFTAIAFGTIIAVGAVTAVLTLGIV